MTLTPVGCCPRQRSTKIGHHGSHNSTPKRFVEEILDDGSLSSDFFAAASVTRHGSYKEIPKKELMDELRAKSSKDRVVRSDAPPSPQPPRVTVNGNVSIDIAVPFK